VVRNHPCPPLRSKDLVVLSGRGRLDAAGNAGHTDLARQTSDAFDEIRTSLRALEGDFNALVKLMVFYVQQETLDENTRRQLIAIQRDAGSAVVLTMVPLRFLAPRALRSRSMPTRSVKRTPPPVHAIR
jgi:enamine deaminase RidA (YjgF/YER057c/UK114 family)